jgi:ABC-2 type transport system permease protein
MTAPRPAPVGAFRAEWTKLWTVRSTAALPFTAAAVTVAGSVFVCAAADPDTVACADGCDPARLTLAGVYCGQAAVALLAVLVTAGEYRTGLIRCTLAAVPWRLTAFGAKATAVVAAVLPAALVAIVGAVAIGRPLLARHGFVVTGRGETSAADIGAALLYLLLVALLAHGVAAVLRGTTAALTVVLALLYLPPVAALLLTDARWSRYAPAPTGRGLAVLAVCTAATLLLGATLFSRRDP